MKKFIIKLKYTAGRNNTGKIVIRHRCSRLSKTYYNIYSNYNLFKNIPFKVRLIIYDNIKNNLIMVLKSFNGIIIFRKYIEGIEHNYFIFNYNSIPNNYNIGNISKLKYLYEGTYISNVELNPNGLIKLFKSSGTSSLILLKENNFIKIRLSSGKFVLISEHCSATIGKNINFYLYHYMLGKAGRAKKLGKKSIVRGVAMNPVDHPHGGGEGKKSKNTVSSSPWGKVYRYKKTSK
jgi:large subunit ribosomal protein L2